MLKKTIFILIILVLPWSSYAQAIPPPVPPPPPPGLPIDGLTGMLFLVGIIFGFKKIVK